MIIGIHHTAISTSDIERAKRFYCELLGAEFIREFSWKKGDTNADRIVGLEDSAAQATLIKLGNSYIELFQFSAPTQPWTSSGLRPVHKYGYTHICIQVSDVEAEYRRLRAAGMDFHCAPQDLDSPVPCTYGRDPDGNVVELLEIRDPAFCPGVQFGPE